MPRLAVPILLVASLLTGPLAGCIGGQEASPASQSLETQTPAAQIAFEQVHHPEQIREIVDDLATLDAVEADRIGTSLEGRPIDLVSVGHGELELWIVGRQHGDEPTGGEAILLAIRALADPDAQLPDDAPAVVEAFREHREHLLEQATFHFVPVANPDGAAAYQRGTATGADPNRDHFAFAHPFSRALREAFWERRPDACLDLHNMGTGDTDYDAYGAEGPLMEAETYQRAVEDANLVVRAVDAAGANGGLYNENYRSPEPADEHPNPTAFHPGTHDVFCTARGAPGWTPEGAIQGGDNGADDPIFAWSTRLHHVTIAAHALHWTGAYDGSEVDVWKESGVAEPTAIEHTYTLEEPGKLTLQTVWRDTAGPGDHNPTPIRFAVTTPEGEVREGRVPHPEAWTSTVHLEEAQPGDYELTIQGLSQADYELRAYARPDTEAIVTVERTGTGLQAQASSANDGPAEVQLTDVFDPANVSASAFVPPADELHPLEGSVGERLVAEWSLTLAPGERLTVSQPDRLEAAGPYHVTASTGERVQTSVEETLNPAPN